MEEGLRARPQNSALQKKITIVFLDYLISSLNFCSSISSVRAATRAL